MARANAPPEAVAELVPGSEEADNLQMSLRRVQRSGAAIPSQRANKPHSIIQSREVLDGPAMRPTTPHVTESGVGESSTCDAGA